MQILSDGTTRHSPRDLIAYLEGDFAAWCERVHAERNAGRPIPPELHDFLPDEAEDEMALLAAYGDKHEKAYVELLRAEHPTLIEITRGEEFGTGFDATVDAMRRGVPVIVQAHLEHGDWHGYADFLIRVNDSPSNFGEYHYEPWDTKLARSAKPYFLLQLCAYCEMLEAIQGTMPTKLGFVFGNNEKKEFPVRAFFSYYNQLKRSFLDFHGNWSHGAHPDPSADRSFGRWAARADAIMEARDDLSRVANISRNQMEKLRATELPTLTALATTARTSIPGMTARGYHRVRTQARLQHESTDVPRYEYVEPDEREKRRGFAMLPASSPSDIFFDMEGFPYATDGLEYLFGAVYLNAGEPEFIDWWAHDTTQEQRAFEEFVDWAYARWQADPTLHIYHYAAYEVSTLTRLMGKYATREREIDDFLRYDVFVDLYTVVRQAMVIGTRSYSLKDIECLYMPHARDEGITTASGSVVAYQKWLDSGEPGQWQHSPLLHRIRDYNEVDCRSTWLLRDWLLERQRESGIEWLPSEFNQAIPTVARAEAPDEAAAKRLHLQAAGESDPERRRITQLLGWLVSFHRREEKPMWWRYFTRMKAPEEELIADFDCLGGLERTATPLVPEKKSMLYQYRFDPDQDTKLHEGKTVTVASTDELSVEIFSLNRDAGLINLKVGPSKTLPDRISIIPKEDVGATALKEAVLAYAVGWEGGMVMSRAADDLLFRRYPRIRGVNPGEPIVDESLPLRPQVIDVLRRLDGSTLCIQGPPGSGKTTTAAHAIAALLADGKRIGVVANSHQVVLNLLGAVADAAGVAAHGRLFKVGGESHPLIASGAVTVVEPKAAADVIRSAPLVIGGTAWLFARPALANKLDYLFVDEAGQVSLANAIAVGAASHNLVLIGDQMQLAQPLQGTHPGDSGLSCLEYVLQGHATIPAAMGIFLGVSYRMHPDITRFISDAFYESRLHSAASTHTNRIQLPDSSRIGIEAGIAFVPVEHRGCTHGSNEEVCVIQELVEELLQGTVTIGDQPPRPVTLNDILLVAPFNMQVRALREKLGKAVQVGSVDLFQGQEAPIVIVSMCTSVLEDAPRGAEFLLSPNRLNVAVSRAKALAIVVGSPELVRARCRSVKEMQLVNTMCELVQYGEYLAMNG